LQKSAFHYPLPKRLIAKHPLAARTASRLLILPPSGPTLHTHFHQLGDYLKPGDLLIMNDTRVLPARLHGHKPTGGAVEILIERLLPDGTAKAQLRASKTPRPGTKIHLKNQTTVRILSRTAEMAHLQADRPWPQIMQEIGHTPLPPYIDRPDDQADRHRYQTVYANTPGAVAAPTAGLHFDRPLLTQLKKRQIQQAHLTLHTAAGTFQPVRTEKIHDHPMHSEWLQIAEPLAAKFNATRAAGGRIVAVGTTSVRALETAYDPATQTLQPYRGDTAIFLYPGHRFQAVDALITNFHLPESTLLMLVAAFAGHQRIMATYAEAIQQNYRFFSYGDAMLLHHNPAAPQDIPA